MSYRHIPIHLSEHDRAQFRAEDRRHLRAGAKYRHVRPEVAEIMRTLRQVGYSQEDIALCVGYSDTTVGRILGTPVAHKEQPGDTAMAETAPRV